MTNANRRTRQSTGKAVCLIFTSELRRATRVPALATNEGRRVVGRDRGDVSRSRRRTRLSVVRRPTRLRACADRDAFGMAYSRRGKRVIVFRLTVRRRL